MISTVLARDAVVAVEALPKRAPEKVVAVRIDVDGLYVTAVFVNAFVVPAPVANSNGNPVLATDEVITMLLAFVAVVDVVALPERAPEKIVADNVPELGLYVNGTVVSSTYRAFDAPAVVIVKGI